MAHFFRKHTKYLPLLLKIAEAIIAHVDILAILGKMIFYSFLSCEYTEIPIIILARKMPRFSRKHQLHLVREISIHSPSNAPSHQNTSWENAKIF